MESYHYLLKVGVTLLLVKLTVKLPVTDHSIYQGAHIFKSKVHFIEYYFNEFRVSRGRMLKVILTLFVCQHIICFSEI
jgi:hypothetical protein